MFAQKKSVFGLLCFLCSDFNFIKNLFYLKDFVLQTNLHQCSWPNIKLFRNYKLSIFFYSFTKLNIIY